MLRNLNLPMCNGILRPAILGYRVFGGRSFSQTADEIEYYIQEHPFVKGLRQDSTLKERRYVQGTLREERRVHHLSHTSLLQPNKIVVPPYCWQDAKRLISVLYLGADVAGHEGMVHGGLLPL